MAPYYERDGATIFLADNREVSIPTRASILGDPPYGMDWDTDAGRFTGGKGAHKAETLSRRVRGDREPFDPAPWLEYPQTILWGANHYAARLPVGTTLVWVKKSPYKLGRFLSDGEIAYQKGGHGVYVFNHVWDGCARESENGDHYHPTQKPVALMSWCLSRLKSPEIVVDPWCGSGSTLVAARLAGLPCVGIEIEERYAEIAARRLEEIAGRTGLFSDLFAVAGGEPHV